jgi:hypothetical protein
LEYGEGKLDKLEELEAEILKFGTKEKGVPIPFPCYGKIVTSNQFTHGM